MKSLIESNGDGSPNFEWFQLPVCCSKDALFNAIKNYFSDDAVALLFFGHGADADGGYLCTTDFTDKNLGVKMTDILQLANILDAKTK